MTADRFLSPLAVRLAAAFVVVAVTATAVLAALTLFTARAEVSDLVGEVHRRDTDAAASAASRAYQRSGGWDGADLSSVAAVAARGQANLVLRDRDGAVIAAPAHEAAELMADMHGVEIIDTPRSHPVTAPVVADGERIGTVELRFPVSHLPTPERQIRDALTRNVVLGATIAVASAVVVAVFVARRVSRPVTALTGAATELAAGRRSVRVGLEGAPGELGALSAAFDRMASAVEREDQLRRRLVADVAHELRTPLTILRGTTEAMVDGVAPADDATLASVHEEVLRLSELVTDLETLAAADAAALHLDEAPVDLAVTAGSVVALAQPTAAACGLRIDTDLRPAPVLGDEARLRQVLTTLVANALAYTPTGGTITVTTRAGADHAEVEVADTGPGLSDEDLPRVFDRFYRGAAGRGTRGSGIGLAVARELVEAHRGEARAANRADGRGASFTVRLPDAPDAPEA